MVAEEDRVVARFTFRGVHRGTWQGIPATGKSVMWPAVIVYRMKDGQIVSFWITEDSFSVLRQLGAIATAGNIAGSPAAV